MLHALRSGALALAMLPAAYVSTLAQGSQGSSPLTPAKGGTNSAYVGFAGPSSTVKTFTLPNASDTIATLAAIQTFSAAKTFSAATLLLAGSSSGATTLNASAVASGTLTLPAATDTLVGRATTDTLTNKTLTTPEITTSLRVTGTTGETLTVGGNLNRLYLSPGSNVPVEIFNSAGTSSGKRFYTTDTQVTLYSSGTSRVNVTGTGFTLTPNGTDTRFQISDTSLQLHYDNIVLAPAANSPGVTWKHVDPLGGLDKPFGNIGVATTDANKFKISSGPTAANIPANNDLIFGTYNATTEIERVKLAGGAATVNLELLNGTGLTVPGTVNFSGLTASLPLGLDSSKNVVSYNTTGVAGSAIALANSPTLTTPALGVATATSMALGGASIGANALATTGQNVFNGANETGTTTGYYSSWSFDTTAMIQRNVTNLNSPNIYGLGVDMQVNNSVAGLANAGFITFITTPSGYATNQGTMYAWLAQNIHQGTGSITTQNGMASASFNTSSGTISSQLGSSHTASNSGTGAISSQVGVQSSATSSGASAITSQSSFSAIRTFSGAATVGVSTGLEVRRPTGGASATFTNTYGVQIANQTPTAGTFTNPTIGILIESQTGSGSFAIQQNGSGINRFEGALLSNGATSGIGYTTGAGGSVTQATSKSTAVTLNKATGLITMNNAALAADTIVTFVFNNSAVAATDLILATHDSGGTTGAYSVNCRATGAGTAACDVRNNTGGSLSEAIVIRFSLFKSANT